MSQCILLFHLQWSSILEYILILLHQIKRRPSNGEDQQVIAFSQNGNVGKKFTSGSSLLVYEALQSSQTFLTQPLHTRKNSLTAMFLKQTLQRGSSGGFTIGAETDVAVGVDADDVVASVFASSVALSMLSRFGFSKLLNLKCNLYILSATKCQRPSRPWNYLSCFSWV